MYKKTFGKGIISRITNPILTKGIVFTNAAQTTGGGIVNPTSIIIEPDHEFMASSYVHAPLADAAAIDPVSSVYVASITSQISDYFGVASVNFDAYAPPIYIVGPDQPTVQVLAQRAWDMGWTNAPLQAQFAAVPLPSDFAASAGTDQEAVVYQPSTGRYWEFWIAELTGSTIINSVGQTVPQWRAAWGGKIENLATNPGYFAGGFGTTATGLPFLAGTMTVAEQQAGVINHPIHISMPLIRSNVFVSPAQRTDGVVGDADAIPAGTRFRFPRALDLTTLGLTPYALMIAKAVQDYGMIVRDTSGSVNFTAENPGTRYHPDPYTGLNGLFNCPGGVLDWTCYPTTAAVLTGFPFSQLVALDTGLRTTLDSTHKSSSGILSAGNLAFTDTLYNGVVAEVRATDGHSAGKRYFETNVAFPGGVAGIGLAHASYVPGSADIYNSPFCIGMGTDGAVYCNGVALAYTGLSYVAGNKISIAYDRGANKVWFRVNSGNWNNSPTANPATGAEGISWNPGAGVIYPLLNVTYSGPYTANFGASAYAHTVPNGYLNW